MENQNQSSPAQNPTEPVPAASTPLQSVPQPTLSPVTPLPTPAPSAPPPSVPKSGGNRVWWIVVLIILFVGVLSFVAWYSYFQFQKTSTLSTSPNQSTGAVQKPLIIGTDPTFQPMEYTQNGKMVGYDIDLANLLSKQLGEKIEFKNIIFDNLFTSLQQRQIDMIISAVTITDERKKKYDFSEPYLNAGQVIITQKTNTLIKSPTDLKGKKIAVQQGTTDEAEALKYTASNLVIRYPDFVQATKALVGGSVDAIVTDLPSAQGIVSSNPTLKISSDPFTNDYYGIVFRKGDPNIKKVNSALDSLRVRGYLTELKHKWLD